MAKLLKEIKKETLSVYGPGDGNFFKKTGDFSLWQSCREEFHDEDCHKPMSTFYYTLNYGQKIGDIVSVLSYFEKQLKLKSQIKIQKIETTSTARKYICFRFDLPVFWRCPVRNNLLTLIIKHIRFSYRSRTQTEIKKQLKKIAEKENFSFNSIELFLKGNTFYQQDKFYGWVDTFKEMNSPLAKKSTKNKSLICAFNENFTPTETKKA